MITKELKEKLEEIEGLVEGLKEPVKSITAQEMVRKLLGTGGSPKISKRPSRKRGKGKQPQTSSRMETIRGFEEKDKKMLEAINRTEHPEIHRLDKSIDRALYILGVMKDLDYDGLNPSQILKILTEVFRIKAKLPAVSMALINDKYYTLKEESFYKGTKANKYKIMKAGEDHIKEILKKKNIHEKQEEPAGEP